MAAETRINNFTRLSQSAFLPLAMVVAGGFDYLANIVAGRSLAPAEFFVFVTVTALLQIVVHATNVIRNVVAFYSAEATVFPDRLQRVGDVLRRSWHWAVRWGLLAMALAILVGPLLSRFLHIGTPWPFWAAAFAVLLLFLRPVTDGALQGVQQFVGLGSVQITQAVLRLGLVATLIWLGLEATGAILALPLASTAALILAIVLLRNYFRAPPADSTPAEVSWRYSLYTFIGLLAFALMVNMDAIVVRRLFGDAAAEAYAPVVTLGKMNLFIPLGIGLVLFPKATRRHAEGRDSRPVLLTALAATLAPGLALTLLFALFPGQIVQGVFGEAYVDPGRLLALVGLATTLYAGVNIWLNYGLSLERRSYVLALAAVVGLQLLVMLTLGDTLAAIAWVMIAAGLAGNVLGALLTLGAPAESEPSPRHTQL